VSRGTPAVPAGPHPAGGRGPAELLGRGARPMPMVGTAFRAKNAGGRPNTQYSETAQGSRGRLRRPPPDATCKSWKDRSRSARDGMRHALNEKTCPQRSYRSADLRRSAKGRLTGRGSGCTPSTLFFREEYLAAQSADPKARSSVVEHYLDTVGVDSSILSAPTSALRIGTDTGISIATPQTTA
jgi:hypothetical protein